MYFHNGQIKNIVDDCWQAIPKHFPNVKLDEYIIMPNHIHGIIIICKDGVYPAPKLGTIIGLFKSASSKITNRIIDIPDKTLWQSRFYDHIIRKDEDMNEIRKYIQDNPINWAIDENNPNNW